ncbi:hypothetical protein YC2023_086466 [Brassica napus]
MDDGNLKALMRMDGGDWKFLRQCALVGRAGIFLGKGDDVEEKSAEKIKEIKCHFLLFHVLVRQFRRRFLLPPSTETRAWPSSHDMTTSANNHKLRLRSRLCAGFSATT